MTREEAIDLLGCIYMEVSTDADKEAVDMAIEALKERPHGEWKTDGTCSECGVYSSLNKDTTYFCPNCGADMRKEGE